MKEKTPKISPADAEILDRLLAVFRFEETGDQVFQAPSHDLGFGNLYGGLVVAQALHAATLTVGKNFHANSLHGYFMDAGNTISPIRYQVETLRNGSTFSFRQVKAVQDQTNIFTLSASFQKPEEGLAYQTGMPDVKGPESLVPEHELARGLPETVPEWIRERMMRKRPVEIRPVNPVDPFHPEVMEPVKYVWLKALDTLPDDPLVHKNLLAYASDFHVTGTMLYPHGRTYWQSRMQVASLDHAIWFYGDFRMDEWILHEIRTDISAGGRGLSRGRIFTRDGRLIAATAQEGLIRLKKRS